MKKTAIPAILIGLILAITLIATNDVRQIWGALATAGWGIAIVVLLHVPQIFVSGMGWRSLLDRRESVPFTFGLRWIRESVNSLLPVAQLGGDVVRARMLARHGPPFAYGVAVSMVDLAMETVTQAIFTITIILLLVAGPHMGDVMPMAIAVTVACVGIAGALFAAQRYGMFVLLERAVDRLTRGQSQDFAGLHDFVVAIYRRPVPLIRSSGWHLASWFLGGLETYAALHVLGLDASLREAMIVEGLGCAVRAAGFIVPASLGVQEGGYILICSMFGIPPQKALALSLIRRIREIALGLPGLAFWHRLEARGPSPAAQEATG